MRGGADSAARSTFFAKPVETGAGAAVIDEGAPWTSSNWLMAPRSVTKTLAVKEARIVAWRSDYASTLQAAG